MTTTTDTLVALGAAGAGLAIGFLAGTTIGQLAVQVQAQQAANSNAARDRRVRNIIRERNNEARRSGTGMR